MGIYTLTVWACWYAITNKMVCLVQVQEKEQRIHKTERSILCIPSSFPCTCAKQNFLSTVLYILVPVTLPKPLRFEYQFHGAHANKEMLIFSRHVCVVHVHP